MPSKRLATLSAASVSFVNVPFNGYVLFDSGDLTRQELGLTVNPLGAAWDSEMTRLSFEVLLNNRGDFDQSNDTWLYRYTFTVPEKAISNVLLETSQGINLLGGTTRGGREGPGTFGDSGGSAPGIPGTLFGLKFNTTGDPLSFSWQVETDRAPMWGDFYAKSGRIRIDGEHFDVYAFNLNFGQDAPDYVQGVAVDGFAIVPNLTTGGPPAVPVPAAVWLLGSALGLVPVIARRRAA
jgi:hypothetical protein